ncbi:hypothetical protein [Rhodobacter maris]|uniref:Uncharacterized protein n=1 Tax=Rhodobacter maris TaxID=446682 RepID=A0A285SIF3_9RHOB|nr:hypothetical protein [Rhodobacter maris]SOC05613.1 hypothetical protein SAMN05877831_104185 [Rhodobacter maris]
MNTKGQAFASVFTLLLTAGICQAETCADRDHVVSKLKSMFGESLIANAASSRGDGAVLEVYATPDAATWSILVALPERGLACLAATGRGREDLNAALNIAPTTQLAQR